MGPGHVFGFPRIITRDKGPQFAVAWWRTLCACLGVRQVFEQAYYSQANGRAEAAGKELQRKLRHLHEDAPHLSWVEALPIAVQKINDSPGECGNSRNDIVTGRKKNFVGVPLSVEHEAQNALDLFRGKRRLIKKWHPL